MSQDTEHIFMGVHILGEMYGVDFKKLNDKELLEKTLKEGVVLSGATLCSLQTKVFEPYGVTSLALLSESHASLHTYPDFGSLFFDAFTCGTRCQPQKIADHLIEVLKPTSHNLKVVYRGDKKDKDSKVLPLRDSQTYKKSLG